MGDVMSSIPAEDTESAACACCWPGCFSVIRAPLDSVCLWLFVGPSGGGEEQQGDGKEK